MKKTYHGSCHCKAVTYEADLDFSQGSFKCNCTICAKGRNWLAAVGEGEFRLLSGEGNLSDYQFGKKNIHHQFCTTCGISPFSWGTAPGRPGKSYVVKLATLDDATPEELAAIPVMYGDGLHDDFSRKPDIFSYL